MEIISLFPTAVLRDRLDRDFTDAEVQGFVKLQNTLRSNEGNRASEDFEVLELPEFANLKQFCLEKVRQYFKEILKVPDETEPYITLSWTNYTNTGQHHHRHSHSNSIVSGVLYINAHREADKIEFYNLAYKTIDFDATEFNVFNATSWWLPVGTGDIIIFPSNLIHGVPISQRDYTRISLSFNTFVRGEIGIKDQLKWIKIK